MKTEWITDRLPTEEDAVDGQVLITTEEGIVDFMTYSYVANGEAWQRIPPAYVNPKRWTVEWDVDNCAWTIRDKRFVGESSQTILYYISKDSYDAARRICDIYNEVMP